jgi:hypothetical protein
MIGLLSPVRPYLVQGIPMYLFLASVYVLSPRYRESFLVIVELLC